MAALAPSAGGPSALLRFDPAGPQLVAPDLRAPLRRGTRVPAATTAPYLAPSRRGDLLVDGASGQPLLAAPAGVRLTTPVEAGAFQVFVASAAGQRAAVLRLPDGTLLALPGTAVADALVTAGPGLLLDGAAGLVLVDLAGVHTLGAGASHRVVLSGLGTADA